MPRIKKFDKRKFRGNQFTNKASHTVEGNLCISSSGKKLPHGTPPGDSNFCVNNDAVCSGFVVVDVSILSSLIKEVAKCKQCDGVGCLEITEQQSSRKGLASKLVVLCRTCNKSTSKMTSNIVNNSYDVNLKLVYAMRAIGKGRKAAQTFCGLMDLPPPPSRFSKYIKILLGALTIVSKTSMKRAVEETVNICGTRDIAVAVDGTWQRRGHRSLNGVVSATSLENGKVVDVECLSKYCHTCHGNTERHIEHQCSKNYDGYSGGMECDGALQIFQRSVPVYNVRYTKYLGDGDSKAFHKINECNVYGDTLVTKLECCGHVQKRMGARLRKLRREMKGKLLSDGKSLSGRGRLTETEIDLLQNYYGLAIRRTAPLNDVTAMRKAVWAIYFHKLSTDDHPVHGLCPKGADSWCGYQKAKESGLIYHHKHSLPEPVLNEIKPIFRDLSDPVLLSKCLHGGTQNTNESFNHCIWERLPKNVFVGLNTLKVGVLDAVICFNDGVIGRLEVLRNLGIKCGSNMEDQFLACDRQRVHEAERFALQVTKEARSAKRNAKRKLEDEEMLQNEEYASGMF